MIKPLTGTKIAVLVANGFEEKSFLAVQKMMLELGATLRVISTNQGLVNGWDSSEGTGAWGHNYAVDAPLNTALGVDYEALIIPGGQRSLDKLKLTAHTRRFIGSFMAAEKPVAAMGDAVMLMAMCEQATDMKVTGPENTKDICLQSGADWIGSAMEADKNLLTGLCDGEHQEQYFSTMHDLMMQAGDNDMDQAA